MNNMAHILELFENPNYEEIYNYLKESMRILINLKGKNNEKVNFNLKTKSIINKKKKNYKKTKGYELKFINWKTIDSSKKRFGRMK